MRQRVAVYITCSGRPAAGDADVARHAGKEDRPAHALLAVGMALRPVAEDERGGLCRGIAHGKLADGLRGNARDALGPLRRFGRAVALAHEIRPHALPHGAGRHMRLVKAETAAVQKRPVRKPLRPDDVGHGVQKSGVRGRAQADPLGAEGADGIAPARVDDDDGSAPLPCPAQIVHRSGVELRLGGVVPPEQDQAAVQPRIPAGAGQLRAVHETRRLLDAGRAVGVVIIEKPAVQREQTLGQTAGGKRGGDARRIVYIT